MINVFKKVLLTAACVLFVQFTCAQENGAEPVTTNHASSEATVVTTSDQAATVVAQELVNQKFLVTYKVNGRVYYQRSVPFGTIIETVAAPVKEGFVFSGWKDAPATMPAQNVVITGSLVAATEEQPTQSELLAKK